MRGDNDNVHLTVNYKDGTQQVFPNVNNKARWVDNYSETVPLILNRRVAKTDIKSFVITTTFGGGTDSDNWDLNMFEVTNGGNISLVCANCDSGATMPLVRFTGNNKPFNIPVH